MLRTKYPTRDRLRQVLRYDRRTGIFYWRIATAYATKVGSIAGGLCGQGYIKIQIDGVTCQAHLLAWLYVYGTMPKQLEHRDLDKANNRIANLRKATQSQNIANTRKRSGTSSSFKGVTFHRQAGKWQASIKYQGKSHHLGLFPVDQESDAGDAYAAAAKRMFGEFARIT
jgi:hypothetical protein